MTLTSASEYQPLLEYTDRERAQSIPGLEQGSWLESNSNYRHSVTVEGLEPGTRYRYTVSQSGVRHTGTFQTAPSSQDWQRVRVVAFADSETEPAGRVEHREWEINPVSGYAEGSLPRPGPGSL